jgi:CubicO group peptidase (beta-lactamase class C family)
VNTILRLSCIALAAVGFVPASPGAQPADLRAWLDAQASAFSGVVLIGRDDAIEIEAAYGMADPKTNRPNTPATRFNLGSINKTFTAVAIAQLIQQGRLSLDDTLAKHLPDYPNQAAAARITIRDLLSHRSGVAQFRRADFGDVSLAAQVKAIGAEPQAFEPGTRAEYSNGGYIVLGRLIEVVTGKSYDDYVSAHIYRPAGMTATGFFRPGDRADRLALPPSEASAEPRTGNPAGGGYSTAADLFRFARALRTGRLLDQRMTTYLLHGTFTEEPRWGFSLREQPIGTQRFIGNGGGAPGVNAEFRFDPAGSRTVVVLANASPPAATTLLTAILNRVAQSTPSVEADITSLNAAMVAAFHSAPSAVAAFYADDAVITGGGQRHEGRAAIDGYWRDATMFKSWTLELLQTGGAPEAPWQYGKSVVVSTSGRTMETYFLGLLRREGGSLKFVVDAYSRDRKSIGPEETGRITAAWLKASRGDAATMKSIKDDPFSILASPGK